MIVLLLELPGCGKERQDGNAVTNSADSVQQRIVDCYERSGLTTPSDVRARAGSPDNLSINFPEDLPGKNVSKVEMRKLRSCLELQAMVCRRSENGIACQASAAVGDQRR
jgi:hypothetical protein